MGSLGRDESYETVEEVYVRNCSFTNTTNGARIKTAPVSIFILFYFLLLKKKYVRDPTSTRD